MTKGLFFLLALMQVSLLFSQEVQKFSLKEAQAFALEHNYDMRNSNTDIQIAEKKVKESLAIGLPQVNGRLSNTNYISVPTTLMPDFLTPAIFGVNEYYFDLQPVKDLEGQQFFPVQFGTEYNASAEISASQILFSGQYLVGVRAARTFLERTRMENYKTELDVKDAIARAYYFVLVTEDNHNILSENLKSLEDMAWQTRETFKLGFIEETDADQLDLLVANLKTTLLTLENQIDIAYSNLKYNLGLKLEDEITLTDNLDDLLEKVDYLALINTKFDVSGNIDYQILKKQKELAFNQLKLEQSAYLPSLNAFFTAQTQAMRNEYNFFDTEKEWYPSSFWGVEMSIPIFSSGNRAAKVQMAKLELEKMDAYESQMKSGLTINENTSKNDFSNAYLVHQNKKTNLELAERIYNQTKEKFKLGVSGSMDLLQAYNQYLTAESEYINSLLELLDKKLVLEKLFTQRN